MTLTRDNVTRGGPERHTALIGALLDVLAAPPVPSKQAAMAATYPRIGTVTIALVGISGSAALSYPVILRGDVLARIVRQQRGRDHTNDPASHNVERDRKTGIERRE